MSLHNKIKDSVSCFLQWIRFRTFCCFTVGDGDGGGVSGDRMKFRALFGCL